MAFATSNILGVDFSAIYILPDDTGGDLSYPAPPFEPGTIARGSSGTEFVYVQFGAGGSTGLGYIVAIDNAYTALMVDEDDIGALGDIAGGAMAAAAEDNYGWVQRAGAGVARVAASAAANVVLNTTGTAGQIDDDGTADMFEINGLVLTTANVASAGTAAAMYNYPTIGAITT